MKRGKPLQRTTSLRSTKPLKRSAIKRKKPRNHASADEWVQIIAAVRARDRDRCQVCGKPLQDRCNYHHVQPRGRGGKDEADNVIQTHPDCHSWVHSHPREARQRGLLK